MALDPTYMHTDSTITSSSVIQGRDASQLNMDDFFNLLVAQLTNQDMMNPTNDTEFIAQMAQFSALQGVQTIQEYQLSSYAASYIGKFVTIANVTESGQMETILGKVESITYYDGNPKVVVNGKAYDLFTVMEINDEDGSGALARAVQLKGKDVVLEQVDEDGTRTEVAGTVTNAGIANGKPYITVNGKNYDLDTLIEIEGIPADEYWELNAANPAEEANIAEMTDNEFKLFFDRFVGKNVVFSNGSEGKVTRVDRGGPADNIANFRLDTGAMLSYEGLKEVDGMSVAAFLKKNPVGAATKTATASETTPAPLSLPLLQNTSYYDALVRGLNPMTGLPFTDDELRREVNYNSQNNNDDRFTRV